MSIPSSLPDALAPGFRRAFLHPSPHVPPTRAVSVVELAYARQEVTRRLLACVGRIERGAHPVIADDEEVVVLAESGDDLLDVLADAIVGATSAASSSA